MISDLDIWRAAQATIKRYGDGAALHATQRADELLVAVALAVWWAERRVELARS